MIFCHKVLAWVVLSLGLKRKKARAFEGLKNGLGLTPCKAQQVGLLAFVSLGSLGRALLNTGFKGVK